MTRNHTTRLSLSSQLNSTLLLLLLVPLLGLSACSGEPIERYVELQELKAKAVAKAGDNCEAIDSALDDFQTEYGEELETVERSLMDLGENDKEELEQEYGERLREATMSVAEAQAQCR